jgi:hypothetical protein
MKPAPSRLVRVAPLDRLAVLDSLSARYVLTALVGIAVLGSTGCGALLRSAGGSDACPVSLVPSGDLPPGMLLRQRVRIENVEPAIGMDVIVQSRDGVLTLVGFTPFGTRAFALTQRGIQFELNDVAGRHLGVNPVWILDALHRSRFILPPPGEHDEIQRWERDGEAIVRRPGTVDEPELRTFRLASSSTEIDQTDDRVLVEYSGPSRARVRVRNPWCGYDIRIVTSTEEAGP